MNLNVSHETQSPYDIDGALLIYRSRDDYGKAIVSRHKVVDGNLMPGDFIDPTGAILTKFEYFVSPNDVYLSNDLRVWKSPAKNKQAFVYQDRVEYKRCPNLMWAIHNESLYVWRYRCIKGKYYLYHPRMWNVHSSGNVCMGGIKVTSNMSNEKIMEKFWQTAFSHSLCRDYKQPRKELTQWIKDTKTR